MLKHLILAIISFLPLCCNAQTLYDAGVSKALAEYRTANIENVRYHLTFSIPAERTAAVEGNEVVRFELPHATDVVLDFRAPSEQVKSVKINGHAVDYIFQQEHIVIPAAATRSGRNIVSIAFTACDQSLNRSDDYMYTLFVPDRARTAFPCFDQPDIKARYTLTLEVPEAWSAVGNTKAVKTKTTAAVRTIEFAESEPLPTYLFAFAAGVFQTETYSHNGRSIVAYYRETDPARVAQLPEIFRQVEYALEWQEDFTGVPYPFAKYDIVILPGFQFGGMEHTGATFYNDNTIFLSKNPTPDEVLARANLIAHETSHMWFGDYVTMRWFDDVWTKEVFANYFAAEITTPQFPEVNHQLNRLRTYAAAAYSEDRTWANPVVLANGETLRSGGTSIRQPLDNLRNAGLVYNNIIYNKAPLMMYKMVEIMGQEAFREGIREYVKTFAYGNATWDDLVDILDRHTPADLKAFSRAWVNEKGMPTISLDIIEPKSNDDAAYLTAVQSDPYGRGLTWPQSFNVRLLNYVKGSKRTVLEADTVISISLTDAAPNALITLPAKWADAHIVPNSDGRGYGVFKLGAKKFRKSLSYWYDVTSGTERQAVLMNLHENYLLHGVSDSLWLSSLITALASEDDPLTASTMCSYLGEPILHMAKTGREAIMGSVYPDDLVLLQSFETRLKDLAENHNLPSVRTQLIRVLMHYAIQRQTIDWLYDIWQRADNPLLSVRDYMALSYELALRRPSDAEDIIATQRERLEHPADGSAPNADRIREYDFVSRAVNPYRHYIDVLFEEMLTPEGRRIEPWSARVLSLLNHPLREVRSVSYITPSLEVLEDVQRTGDIFFPANWCAAVLGEHLAGDAREEVLRFLNAHPDYNPLLRNKILNGASRMFR